MVINNWALDLEPLSPASEAGPSDFVPSDLRTTAAEPSMVELPLLLPHWQIDAIETEARKLGLTTGQLLRRLIGDFFQRAAFPRPATGAAATPA